MTNRKQERIAKNALEIFLDAWCSVDERKQERIAKKRADEYAEYLEKMGEGMEKMLEEERK